MTDDIFIGAPPSHTTAQFPSEYYLYLMSTYFTYEDLVALKGLEKKKLTGVVYNYWQNKTKPGEAFEFLDKLELKFSDGSHIVLSTTEDDNNPGIVVVRDFDFEKSRLMLLHEFGGKIDMRMEDLTQNPLWTPAIGKTLAVVGLVDDGEQSYRNDAIMLDFGDEKLEIHPAFEGLMVEPYEEV